MHHAEISKIVEVFEDFMLGMESHQPPVTIESFLRENGGEGDRGIQIIFQVLNSKIIAEINDTDEDCNEVRLHFYLKNNSGCPDVSVLQSEQEFETNSIRFFVRSALWVLKDKIPLSRMKNHDFYNCTALEMI
jgi:hypothetical protein